MSFTPQSSLLLLVDLQARLLPVIAQGEVVVANAIRLARAAQLMAIPVLATEQNPQGLGANIDEIRELAAGTLTKQYFDATREAAWASFLPPSRPDVVVAGCEAHVCVLQTVMGLRRSGHLVRLVRDAVGSRNSDSRDAAISRAEHYGAEIVTTEMVIFEWLQTAENPQFRKALQLVK